MAHSPVLIIKRPKKAAHGHHGGAWKVAYADFVTAMMAFFLLLWLLNSVSSEKLQGISDYFAPISTPASTGGAGSLLGGRTVSSSEDRESGSTPTNEVGPDARSTASVPVNNYDDGESEEPSRDELDAMLASREQQEFDEAAQELRRAIDGSPALRALGDNLRVEDSPEGLRIQIMDREGLPMFPRGSAAMHEHTHALLKLIADVIKRMPQDVAIAGHTDATPFTTENGYGNWELSADRANAARRTLVEFGVPEARIARVVGEADTEPLVADDPEAPANRRLSVTLLRGTNQETPPAASAH